MSLPPHRFDYSPIIERPAFQWPGGARVAVWLAPNIEFYEYLPPKDPARIAWPLVPAAPDVREYGHRDYANRVGFWRMLEVLDKYEVRCGVSLNVAVLEHHPEVAREMIARNWDFMGHGIYNSRYLNSCTEEEEVEFYRDMIETLRKHTGKTMKGVLGPAFSMSERTPDLMAEAGLQYIAGFMHDDQPFPVKVRKGRLISVPYTVELNDGPLFQHGYDGEYLFESCRRQVEQLYREGGTSARAMCISLHPYRMGLPHRKEWLDKMLRYLTSHEGVWIASADEISDCYYEHCHDAVASHLTDFNPSDLSAD